MSGFNARNRPKKHGRRYPWNEWFGCGRFRLNRGEHFAIQTHSMAMVARQAARKRNPRLRLSINVHEDYIIITVADMEAAVSA